MPLYPKYEIALGAQATNTNLLTGIVKMVLVTSGYVYSATHEFLADIPVPSRIGMSASLTNKIYTASVFRSDPIYFPSLLSLEAVATVLFIDTGVASTSRLVFYNNEVQGFPTTPAAGSDATIYPAGYLFSLSSEGGGGTVVWGGITGTLSNQADLQTALAAKSNTGHGHTIVDISGLQGQLDLKATVVSVSTVSNDLASVTTVVAGKQNALGFTPENTTNKSVSLTSPNDVNFPTTKAVSDALAGKSNTLHTHLLTAITDVTVTATEINYSAGVTSAIQTQLNAKQATLVSATNIKTVNGQTLLGSGDIAVSGGVAWGNVTGTLSNQTDLQTALNGKSNTGHGHGINDISGLQTALDGKATTASVTTVSTDLASLTTVVAGKQNTLGFTPENISNKATNLTSPDNTKYPTTLAVSNAISGITKSTLGLSLVENTALSTWAGSTNLATLGTIITGTWNGTAINDTYISSASVWNNKQNALVSGTTIKTVNSQSLLGSGDITISGSVAWGNVTGTLSSQADLLAALNAKQNAITNSDSIVQGTTNLFLTSSERTKLTGIQAGAEVNVNPDWNAVSGDAQILNKPTTLAGYGITDSQPLDSDLTAIAALATTSFGRAILTQADSAAARSYIGAGTSNFDGNYNSLSNIPTSFTPSSHNQAWATITGTPTTLSGYGITDAQAFITAGTTAQYYRGDKTYQTLDKAAVGLALVENTALTTWTGSSSITTLGTIVTGIWNGTAINDTYISSASVWNNKQNALVSGTTIKTVNGETLLGSGNLTITGGSGAAWGGITGTLSNQTDLQTALNNKISTGGLKTVNGNSLEGTGNITITGGGGSSPTITTLTDAATVTFNSDTTTIGILTSLSQNTTIANPAGTPVNYQELVIRISSSSIRRLTWGNIYASTSGLLPNTTSGGGREDYFQFRYNALDTKWDLVQTNQPSDEVELSYLTSSLILTGNL